MADTVTSRTLYDDGGHAVLMFTNVSDGTGESAVIKVDASAMVGGGSTTRYAIEAVSWCNVGMGFNLLFDANTDVLAFTTGNTTSVGFLDFMTGQGGGGNAPGTGPGKTGITNNGGAGVTGDILLTTNGHTSGDTYWFMLWIRKTAA